MQSCSAVRAEASQGCGSRGDFVFDVLVSLFAPPHSVKTCLYTTLPSRKYCRVQYCYIISAAFARVL